MIYHENSIGRQVGLHAVRTQHAKCVTTRAISLIVLTSAAQPMKGCWRIMLDHRIGVELVKLTHRQIAISQFFTRISGSERRHLPGGLCQAGDRAALHTLARPTASAQHPQSDHSGVSILACGFNALTWLLGADGDRSPWSRDPRV
jgi:hypothetical protein